MVGEPGVFQPEDGTPGGFRGGSQMQRDMVRSRPRGRCECGVGKGKAPFRIDEHPIQPSEDRGVLLVGPGKLAVEKGNFEEAQLIYEVVKGGGLLGIDISVRLITGSPDQVEVTHESSRASDGREIFSEGGQERLLKLVEARPVNVDDYEGEIVGPHSKGCSNREIVNGVMKELQ